MHIITSIILRLPKKYESIQLEERKKWETQTAKEEAKLSVFTFNTIYMKLEKLLWTKNSENITPKKIPFIRAITKQKIPKNKFNNKL